MPRRTPVIKESYGKKSKSLNPVLGRNTFHV